MNLGPERVEVKGRQRLERIRRRPGPQCSLVQLRLDRDRAEARDREEGTVRKALKEEHVAFAGAIPRFAVPRTDERSRCSGDAVGRLQALDDEVARDGPSVRGLDADGHGLAPLGRRSRFPDDAPFDDGIGLVDQFVQSRRVAHRIPRARDGRTFTPVRETCR